LHPASFFGLALESATSALAQVQLVPVITNVAGIGAPGYSGDNGPAINAALNEPFGAAVDASGNVYIADYGNNRIRMVSPSGIITTVAGNGTSGYSGDSGSATNAELNEPYGVALDGFGNIYIADFGNGRIRKVNTSGIITTVAGNGTYGYSGDNGPATNAQLQAPSGVALDASGNIYIADIGNDRIRKVNTSGVITTVAGNGTYGYSGDNGSATNAELNEPLGMAVDASGNLYIADEANNRIRKVGPSGIITTVAGYGPTGFSGDNGPATGAELWYPSGVALDASGNLYIADQNNDRIRKVNASGIITTIAGNGTFGYSGNNGPATSAELDLPVGVTLDCSGNLYIADRQNEGIRKVSEVAPSLFEAVTSFPTTAIGSSAGVQNVLIETTATETITSISVPVSQGGFQEFSVGAITGCTTGASNPSGTTCTIPVTFTPAYPGLRQLPLQVVTSAGNVSFGLQGTGIGPQVALTPGSSLPRPVTGLSVFPEIMGPRPVLS
jgi:sugar lactone lactonase YvrE